MILLTSGKSIIKILQRIGRSLRPDCGSNTVYIHDFMNALHPMLARHAKKRLEVYENPDNAFEVVDVSDYGKHLKKMRAVCIEEATYEG